VPLELEVAFALLIENIRLFGRFFILSLCKGSVLQTDQNTQEGYAYFLLYKVT
jgi:hypothetical protein